MNDQTLERDVQLELPLDERYRQAEQYALVLDAPTRQQPTAEIEDGSCPYHKAFHYECHYCNPR